MAKGLLIAGALCIVLAELALRSGRLGLQGRPWRIVEAVWTAGVALVIFGIAAAVIGVPF